MELEERIVTSLSRRDLDGAVTEALQGYGPQILGYIRSVIRDPEDAAEVFSQFAEDLWRGIAGFRGECTVRVWAYKLAWHAASRFARDPYRRRRERMETTLASRLAEHLLSSAGRSQERRAAEVDRLRQLLTPEEQTLLVLRIDRRLSWREVALVLGGAEPTRPDGSPGPAGSADGPGPDESTLRKRFERLKDKLARLAREEGLIKG
jgi:RNA polymerase sigma-70 factor (ECF subfamily)